MPRRYALPPVDPDRTSFDEEMRRVRAWIIDLWAAVEAAGTDGDPDMLTVDLVEGLLIDRLATGPDDARRALAFCFLVAVRAVVRDSAGDAG